MSLPDAVRVKALRDLPSAMLGGSRAASGAPAKAVLKLITSSRLAIREAAIWCAYALVEHAEVGWTRSGLSRQAVDRAVQHAKELGLKRGTTRRIRTHQRSHQ